MTATLCHPEEQSNKEGSGSAFQRPAPNLDLIEWISKIHGSEAIRGIHLKTSTRRRT